MFQTDQSHTEKYGRNGTIETERVFSEAPAPLEARMTDYTATRSMLKTKAMAEPGDTPARRAYYNLLEMTENHDKTSDPEQRRQLAKNIERELGRLAGL